VKAKNLFDLMKNATKTEITCIEELLSQAIKVDLFELDVIKIIQLEFINSGNS
jgi:hypothetical protein